MDKHWIISDFGRSEVRRKSESTLAPFFREWVSVTDEFVTEKPEWQKLKRRETVCGYPRMDIFHDWLMDFASISANQLGRSDWRNFRRMLLIHVPTCPLFCWYCFNDAWPCAPPTDPTKTTRTAVATSGTTPPSEIIAAFKCYREGFAKSESNQVNVLRVSGGEPFMYPEHIAELATEFEKAFQGVSEPPFLWVDTNLVPLAKSTDQHRAAIDALKLLGARAAIHACLHGADDASFVRNTGNKNIEFSQLLSALGMLIDAELHVYPRINPVGLQPKEVGIIFHELRKIREDLPARTYLGPVELCYESSSDRISLYEGRESISGKLAKKPSHTHGEAALQPANAAVYTWNQLMETTYGVGYAVLPRQYSSVVKPLSSPDAQSPSADQKKWMPLLLTAKGWEKLAYNLKLLELLALPEGANIDVEYENRWVEPTFAAHAFASPTFYHNKPVLFVAAQKRWPLPTIIPLRWGTIKSLTIAKIDARYSINAKVCINHFAVDLSESLQSPRDESMSLAVSRYVGTSNLPFQGAGGYFCQFVGLPLESDDRDKKQPFHFKSVVLDIIDSKYPAAHGDIYYTISEISRGLAADGNKRNPVDFAEGQLQVFEGDEIAIAIESCNPKLGETGYPDGSETEITIGSTDPENIVVAPETIRLSKYGQEDVRVRFPRKGEFNGMLLIRPSCSAQKIAETHIPFQVNVRSEEDD